MEKIELFGLTAKDGSEWKLIMNGYGINWVEVAPVYPMPKGNGITIKYIQEILNLSKLSEVELRQKNRELERTYQGEELTKAQLIFQIIFLMDAPDK